MSAIGFDGGIGTLVVGRSFIEMGRFETVTGAAAGRQADPSKKAKAKSKQ
ncbi:MAG: hypothetical protein ABL952_10540 [Pyrinomonadaceae bacterium]